MTPDLQSALAASPLNAMLQPRPAAERPRPPLALGPGHLALLLAAGQLNGVVRGPDGSPHVVRGTATKVEELVSEETEQEGKSLVTRRKFTERIKLTVRCVLPDGKIVTLE